MYHGVYQPANHHACKVLQAYVAFVATIMHIVRQAGCISNHCCGCEHHDVLYVWCICAALWISGTSAAAVAPHRVYMCRLSRESCMVQEVTFVTVQALPALTPAGACGWCRPPCCASFRECRFVRQQVVQSQWLGQGWGLFMKSGTPP